VKQTLLIVSTFFFLLTNHVAYTQTEWKLEKSSKGINVYTREISETSIKEFKAETVVGANIDELIDALKQVEHHPEWMSNVSHTIVLNDTPEVLQYNMNLPFPFKDRYVVMNSEAEAGVGTYRINMENSDHPPIDVGDMVGIEYIKGYWLFTELDDHTTSVIYQFVSDPGGNMPNWLVNTFIVKNPHETLSNLRDRLE